MNFPDLHKVADAGLLKAGKILIAQPFMADTGFLRSVVLLCECGEEGALGFVLNRPTSVGLDELLPGNDAAHMAVNYGGPVQMDTLHMLHRRPEMFGGTEVASGIHWGGSFNVMQEVHAKRAAIETDVRLFVGYSGWSPGQLQRELEEGSWLVADMSQKLIFETHPDDIWQEAVFSLGNEYRYLAGLPLDPNLN